MDFEKEYTINMRVLLDGGHDENIQYPISHNFSEPLDSDLYGGDIDLVD